MGVGENKLFRGVGEGGGVVWGVGKGEFSVFFADL